MSLREFVAKETKLKRYYTPKDVQLHNQATDCWVVLFQNVFNLTTLIQQNIEKKECEPLIQNSGKDISYWFDKETGEPKTFIDTKTGERVYFTPMGRFLHIEIAESGEDTPWWKQE